jgi:broad specificity phosphatase PhoE
VAQALAKAPIQFIYSSPMERAQETAGYLAKILNLPVQEAAGIIETDIGEWTGRSVKQCARTKLWKVVQEKPSELRFPGGESFAEIQVRAAVELRAIAERHPEALVACFSHADIIRLVVAHFLEMPLDAFQRLGIDTCSVTVVHFGKDGKVAVPKINQSVGFAWIEKKEEKNEAAKGVKKKKAG